MDSLVDACPRLPSTAESLTGISSGAGTRCVDRAKDANTEAYTPPHKIPQAFCDSTLWLQLTADGTKLAGERLRIGVESLAIAEPLPRRDRLAIALLVKKQVFPLGDLRGKGFRCRRMRIRTKDGGC